jgi:hypothetical protein
VEADPVALDGTGDSDAGRFDDPRHLVAGDDRQRRHRPAARPIVGVGSAHSGRLNPDHHLPGARDGVGELGRFERPPDLDDLQGTHRFNLLKRAYVSDGGPGLASLPSR